MIRTATPQIELRNLHRVFDALRNAGVEVLDDGLRLVPKGKRGAKSIVE